MHDRLCSSRDSHISFIESLIESLGEFEYDEYPCDQCGDYVSRTILNID